MNLPKMLFLDANILIGAALGTRAPALIGAYAGEVWLCAPPVAFDDARRHLDLIGAKREWNTERQLAAMAAMDATAVLVQSIEEETYQVERAEALLRIGSRDPGDWPIVATALALGSPIWTQDRDFFGIGIATWTTDRVELYLSDDRPTPLA